MLALLAWWREAGVSDALTEVPVDWTAHGAAAQRDDLSWSVKQGRDAATALHAAEPASLRPGERSSDQPGRQPPRGSETQASQSLSRIPPPPNNPVPRRQAPAVASAREAARTARTLDELQALLDQFDGCPLKATAKSLCFYRGAPEARIMVIGEAPGRDEDIAGKPFVGRAGQLLDRMLAAVGLSEADVHITNIVYWRPPGNRTPTPEEAQACRPFLERQIELVSPELMLTLGGPAAKAILDTSDGILKVRGRWREMRVGARTIRVMPTLHPAYLLRQPEAKRQAWRDLLQLKGTLDSIKGGKSS